VYYRLSIIAKRKLRYPPGELADVAAYWPHAYSVYFIYERKKSKSRSFKKAVVLWMLILLLLTGHTGNSLTGGSDYLTKPFGAFFGNSN
jgi:hypothetical protein